MDRVVDEVLDVVAEAVAADNNKQAEPDDQPISPK